MRYIKLSDKMVPLLQKSYNWAANKHDWSWATVNDIAGELIKNHTRQDISAISKALPEVAKILNQGNIETRRSNGRTLKLMPPLIENRD